MRLKITVTDVFEVSLSIQVSPNALLLIDEDLEHEKLADLFRDSFPVMAQELTQRAMQVIQTASERIHIQSCDLLCEEIGMLNPNKLLSRSGYLILFSISVDKNSFQDYVF